MRDLVARANVPEPSRYSNHSSKMAIVTRLVSRGCCVDDPGTKFISETIYRRATTERDQRRTSHKDYKKELQTKNQNALNLIQYILRENFFRSKAK